jgi:hypothetical protein
MLMAVFMLVPCIMAPHPGKQPGYLAPRGPLPSSQTCAPSRKPSGLRTRWRLRSGLGLEFLLR